MKLISLVESDLNLKLKRAGVLIGENTDAIGACLRVINPSNIDDQIEAFRSYYGDDYDHMIWGDRKVTDAEAAEALREVGIEIPQ